MKTKFRCFMESIPGAFTQYEGHVDVYCESDDWDDVFLAAVQKLRRTSFPDRGHASWKMLDFQRIG